MDVVAAPVSSHYLVTVRAENPRQTEIDASLAVDGDILEMDEGYAEHPPDRWAKFVHEVSATDAANRPIALEYLGAARWEDTRAAAPDDSAEVSSDPRPRQGGLALRCEGS